MTLFNRPEILLSPPVVSLSNRFENGGTTGALGEPVRGSGGNKDEVFSLPTLFATAPLSDRFSVGLGLFIPFDQVNEYADNWVGRYQLQSISLKTFDIDPAIAYRVSDTLSVGAGIDIQYAHLVRKNAIDFGALCFIAIVPAICPWLALLPESADGKFTADVKSRTEHRIHFSALTTWVTRPHIGFNYRSAIRHNTSGDAKFGSTRGSGTT
jgi:long-chain fatty acid transport protein